MARSIRYLIRGVHGRIRCNYNWPGVITARSVVHVTAGEVKYGTTQARQTAPTEDFHYHLGEANIWVSSISPHKNDFNGQDPGGVAFHLHVDWDSPLDVAVTVTVEDDLPVEIQGY